MTGDEIAAWARAADAMFVPYDDKLGVHPQAELFTDLAVWDFAQTRPDQYPLMLHFPYLQLYRKQVVKQADLVMALHKRGDGFTADEKTRDFAYYEPLTVRDSSLSACIQAVIAAQVGHLDLAYDYLGEREGRHEHHRLQEVTGHQAPADGLDCGRRRISAVGHGDATNRSRCPGSRRRILRRRVAAVIDAAETVLSTVASHNSRWLPGDAGLDRRVR
ncbi:hypothetical protein GCM10023317_31870 [Actinopolymorpha pittospori]